MLGALLWGIGASMALAEENEKAKTKSVEEELEEAKGLLKTLIENCPNTYSGTDIMKQQSKMFKFQDARNKAETFLKEIE